MHVSSSFDNLVECTTGDLRNSVTCHATVRYEPTSDMGKKDTEMDFVRMDLPPHVNIAAWIYASQGEGIDVSSLNYLQVSVLLFVFTVI